jgi:HK97 family phage prohead protease
MPIETTDKYIRARVRMLDEFEQNSFRTVELSVDQGIYSVQGKLIGQSTMTIQSYLFERSKGWDMTKVKNWLKEHKITVKIESENKNKTEIIESRFSIKAEKPTYRIIKDDKGNIIDYQDVRIEGYANTFNIDRGGDQVIPGAFIEHLSEFMANPILLVDHIRETGFAAGKVQTAYEDNNGLKISATLSNAPGDQMRDLRFKVAEGVLRTFSIGGKFFGKMVNLTPEDSRFLINKIELREISIVTVPMNKESLFEVKALDAQSNTDKLESENMAADKSKLDADDDELILECEGEEIKIIS